VQILHTSVVSSTVTNPTPGPLVLPGLPPAAIAALQSPPAGMYAYNIPVYQSDSPLAMPQLLKRYLNFEATEYVNPPMVWNTSVGLAWNAPSYVPELDNVEPHTPPPSTPDNEDDTLLLIQPFETTSPAPPSPVPSDEDDNLPLIYPFGRPLPQPPSPVPAEPLVLSLQDARSVDILAMTNGYQGRLIKYESSSDSSCTLGTHDSARSGDWCEYQKGKKMGMDLHDPFIDDSHMDDAQADSDVDIDAMLNDFKPL
jgi:hypothetical protein